MFKKHFLWKLCCTRPTSAHTGTHHQHQGKLSVALLTPTPLSHHVLRPHIWCTICNIPPNVTGSPSPSLEGAGGERGTRKVILGVNVLWTSLDASGQSRHAAERGRVIISRKPDDQIADEDETFISRCQTVTAPIVPVVFTLLWMISHLFVNRRSNAINNKKSKKKSILKILPIYYNVQLYITMTQMWPPCGWGAEWKNIKTAILTISEGQRLPPLCCCTFRINKVCTTKQIPSQW